MTNSAAGKFREKTLMPQRYEHCSIEELQKERKEIEFVARAIFWWHIATVVCIVKVVGDLDEASFREALPYLLFGVISFPAELIHQTVVKPNIKKIDQIIAQKEKLRKPFVKK
jgi:hypothetical protein